MGRLRNHVFGNPAAVVRYREAVSDRANHRHSLVTPDEVAWKLDMRVLELEKTVPFYRR